MALGNWDAWAVNERGEANRDAAFTSPAPDGVTVEVYKNWLYLHDPKGWQEGGGFVFPIVAEMSEGRLSYKGLHIYAKRGPKEGVYCVVTRYEYPGAKLRAMVACGVYAHAEDGQWLGVQEAEVQFLRDWLHTSRMEKFDWSEELFESFDFDEQVRAIPLELRP